MIRRPSPATVVASVALFFSLTGAGIAASHYLITSVRQIKPSVRHALEHAGPRGVAGIAGRQGPAGNVDLTHTYIQTNATQDIGTGVTLTASCVTGDSAISGGFIGIGTVVTASQLTADKDAWNITAHDDPSFTVAPHTDVFPRIEAWVLCAHAG